MAMARTIGCVGGAVLGLIGTGAASGTIFEWEYINPSKPSEGKRSSSTPCPDGLGVNAGPGADLSGLDLTKAYLIGWNLTGANLAGAILDDADASQAILDGADATGASLRDATIKGASWDNATLVGADLWDSTLNTTTFHSTDISGVDFQYSSIKPHQLYQTANYAAADLRGIDFRQTNLSGGNFTGVNFEGAHFTNTDRANANFSGANLTDVAIGPNGAQSVNFSGANMTDFGSSTTFVQCDFSGADLTDANIGGAILDECDVTGATLDNTRVQSTKFRAISSLTTAQLASTSSIVSAKSLQGCQFTHLDLGGMDFGGSSLKDTRFTSAGLAGADLSGCDIEDARFTDVTRLGLTFAQIQQTTQGAASDFDSLFFEKCDLTGWSFTGASVSDLHLAGSDLRGCEITSVELAQVAPLNNAILPDGTAPNGMAMLATTNPDASLWIFDEDESGGTPPAPILVQSTFSLSGPTLLGLLFDDADWGSTIHFDNAVTTARLDGDLRLEIDLLRVPNPATLDGTTFHVFDWTTGNGGAGVAIDGAFSGIVVQDGFVWDTADLYTTGEVTLISAPPVCVTDLDGDNDTDILDFTAFASAFGTTLGDPAFDPAADYDDNGAIDVFDFTIFIGDFGCPN